MTTNAYLYWACRASMTQERAYRVLHASVESPWSLRSIRSNDPRVMAARDVVLGSQDEAKDHQVSEDFDEVIRETNLNSVEWLLTAVNYGYSTRYPNLYMIGRKGSTLITARILQSIRSAGLDQDDTLVWSAKILDRRPESKATAGGLSKVLKDNHANMAKLLWLPYSSGPLTEQSLARAYKKSGGLPLAAALRTLKPVDILNSKVTPLVELVWVNDPNQSIWQSLDLVESEDQLSAKITKASEKREAIINTKISVGNYLMDMYGNRYRINAYILNERIAQLQKPTWEDGLDAITVRGAAKYAGETMPEFSTMTVEEIQSYYHGLHVRYQSLLQAQEDMDVKIHELQNRLSRLPRQVENAVSLRINGVSYPLSTTSLTNKQLYHVWTEAVSLMPRSQWKESGENAVKLTGNPKIKAYEVLREIEDGLTTESTELFLKLHAVIEWFEAKGKTASRARTTLSALLSRGTVDDVAGWLNLPVADVLQGAAP